MSALSFIGSTLEQLLPAVFSERFYRMEGWSGTVLELNFQYGLVTGEINVNWQIFFQVAYLDLVSYIRDCFSGADSQLLSRVTQGHEEDLDDQRVVYGILCGFTCYLQQMDDPYLPGFRLDYFRRMVRHAIGEGLWYICSMLVSSELAFDLATLPGAENPVQLVDIEEVFANMPKYERSLVNYV